MSCYISQEFSENVGFFYFIFFARIFYSKDNYKYGMKMIIFKVINKALEKYKFGLSDIYWTLCTYFWKIALIVLCKFFPKQFTVSLIIVSLLVHPLSLIQPLYKRTHAHKHINMHRHAHIQIGTCYFLYVY